MLREHGDPDTTTTEEGPKVETTETDEREGGTMTDESQSEATTDDEDSSTPPEEPSATEVRDTGPGESGDFEFGEASGGEDDTESTESTKSPPDTEVRTTGKRERASPTDLTGPRVVTGQQTNENRARTVALAAVGLLVLIFLLRRVRGDGE